MAAAAEGDGGASAEAERVAGLVDDFEVTFDTDRTVVEDCHASAGHERLRWTGRVRMQDSGGSSECKPAARLTVDSFQRRPTLSAQSAERMGTPRPTDRADTGRSTLRAYNDDQ